MQKITKPTKISEIERAWHLLDAKDKTVGRFATEIAGLLMGKKKAYFAKNMDCGDFVVVINAKDVKITGRKPTDKMYYRHSMYPGGFKAESFQELKNRRPEEIIMHAVSGMLPKNKLRDRFLSRLYVSKDENHKYASKFEGKGGKDAANAA